MIDYILANWQQILVIAFIFGVLLTWYFIQNEINQAGMPRR